MTLRPIRNQILQRLNDDDFQAIEPWLKPVTLQAGKHLIIPGKIIEHVWFLESGLCYLAAKKEGSDRSIEVGLLGREGLTDHLTEIGDTSALSCTVHSSGTAMAIEAAPYLEWIKARPEALVLLLRFQRALMVQLSYTALSHGSSTLTERLARWLLMSFDRLDGDDLGYTHDFIAGMLAVRRAGVTTAMHVLEGECAIFALRGRVQLRDRKRLETLAGSSYGLPEREYTRLMGSPRRH